jgi:hypothetical protein
MKRVTAGSILVPPIFQTSAISKLSSSPSEAAIQADCGIVNKGSKRTCGSATKYSISKKFQCRLQAVQHERLTPAEFHSFRRSEKIIYPSLETSLRFGARAK